VEEPLVELQQVNICAGEVYVYNGISYTTSETLTEFFPGGGANGCDSTFILDLAVQEGSLSLPEIQSVEFGSSIRLNPTITNSGSLTVIAWSPQEGLSCTDCLSPLASPAQSTRYQLFVEDSNGCSYQATVFVAVDQNLRVYIPNVFSPNGDGSNDIFYPNIYGPVERVETFRIFDRWGEQVFRQEDFQPNDPAFGWDGTFNGQLLNSAVFVYYLVVELENGGQEVIKGDVTLLR
jgi:gliding motility-associated-like protein